MDPRLALFPRSAPLRSIRALLLPLALLLLGTGAARAAEEVDPETAAKAAETLRVFGEIEERDISAIEETIDELFGALNGAAASVLFYDVSAPFRTAPEAPEKPEGVSQEDWESWFQPTTVDERRDPGSLSWERLYVEGVRKQRTDRSNEELGILEGAVFSPRLPEGFAHAAAVDTMLDHEAATADHGKRAIPFLVIWLLIGAVFMTLRMGFINLRAFKHAIDVTKGKYDNPNDSGEVSHFQALCSALSATVGLGNIAGVAIAVGTGGPGAVFWLIVAGFFGMSTKMVECTLGQKYRKVDANGAVSGGPMQYLFEGLRARGLGGFGRILAIAFACLCIGGSLGGGNTFQVVQSLGAIQERATWLADSPWIYGLVMAVAVAVVIIGGIRRIATTASKIVPVMCGIYVIAAVWILLANASAVPAAFGTIVSSAFTPQAGLGGAIGVMIIGIKRAVFSNEAGVGSAAIAHSAAKTEEPVREGIVALLEPFIDTIVVCTMTGLVIVITGVADDPNNASLIATNSGAALTSRAFESVISWFPLILSAAVVLFAYSTMISWSYYGERCWSHLFGSGTAMIYRLIFVIFTFLGSIVTATNILDFSDLMILSMSFPNLIGLYLLSGFVHKDLGEYMGKLKTGQFKTYD